MQFKEITEEKFVETKRARKSGYRQEVLTGLKAICSNPQNRGRTKESDPLKEKLSTSTLNWLSKELIAAGHKEVELGCTTVKGDKKHMETVTVKVK